MVVNTTLNPLTAPPRAALEKRSRRDGRRRPKSLLHGNVGSVACPAPRSQKYLVRRWLMDTGCGHDLTGHCAVLAHNCPLKEAIKPMTFARQMGRPMPRIALTSGSRSLAPKTIYVLCNAPVVLTVGRRVVRKEATPSCGSLLRINVFLDIARATTPCGLRARRMARTREAGLWGPGGRGETKLGWVRRWRPIVG